MFNATILIVSCLLCMFCLLLRTNGQSQGKRSNKDQIHLYHYPNPLNMSERYDLVDSLHNAQLNKNRRTKIIVHGAGSHCMKDEPFRIIEAYLRAKANGREDYNVLCLDYGPLAQAGPGPGPVPASSVKVRYESICNQVSEKTLDLIAALEANGYVSSFDQIHIIGHSLGGQVSGYIGRKLQERTKKKIGRITGLDIANILLVYGNEVNLSNQLDLSDANFVDIIHTSLIGLKGNYGHVDVYPDGGLHQRSCMTRGPISNVTELIIGGCSHAIVGKYWENSIDSPNITACKDESWESFTKRRSSGCSPENEIIFGEYVPTDARGKYFLEYPMIKP